MNQEEKALEYHIKTLRIVQDLCENGLKDADKPKDSLDQLRDDLNQVEAELAAIKASLKELSGTLRMLAHYIEEGAI